MWEYQREHDGDRLTGSPSTHFERLRSTYRLAGTGYAMDTQGEWDKRVGAYSKLIWSKLIWKWAPLQKYYYFFTCIPFFSLNRFQINYSWHKNLLLRNVKNNVVSFLPQPDMFHLSLCWTATAQKCHVYGGISNGKLHSSWIIWKNSDAILQRHIDMFSVCRFQFQTLIYLLLILSWDGGREGRGEWPGSWCLRKLIL